PAAMIRSPVTVDDPELRRQERDGEVQRPARGSPLEKKLSAWLEDPRYLAEGSMDGFSPGGRVAVPAEPAVDVGISPPGRFSHQEGRIVQDQVSDAIGERGYFVVSDEMGFLITILIEVYGAAVEPELFLHPALAVGEVDDDPGLFFSVKGILAMA